MTPVTPAPPGCFWEDITISSPPKCNTSNDKKLPYLHALAWSACLHLHRSTNKARGNEQQWKGLEIGQPHVKRHAHTVASKWYSMPEQVSVHLEYEVADGELAPKCIVP